MTNNEAIKLLSQEKIPMTLDGKLNEHLMVAHIKAIEALEENDKLKTENERIKENYSVLERQYNNVENSSIRYYNEVKQLKSELEKSIRLPLTNADKIRSMSDEELAEFLSENTNCDCCNIQCVDKLNCPSMSSCLFRFEEWLKSEVSE